MEAKTLEALQGSIAKWEGIVAGTETDQGALNCPLCKLFAPPLGNPEGYQSIECDGCPVKEKTGRRICRGSPYWDAVEVDDEKGVESGEYRRAAQAELNFLKSLLPVES